MKPTHTDLFQNYMEYSILSNNFKVYILFINCDIS